ncbi:DUF1987 domain-containing protein [Paenibacillus nuruki]|nr:DUF1987 domain-containing protein [Paenibacillus nuruki]
MQFTVNATLIIEIEDVEAMCCYRDRDGDTFEDSLRFEIQLQELILSPDCIVDIQFPANIFIDPYYESEKIIQAVHYVIEEIHTSLLNASKSPIASHFSK